MEYKKTIEYGIPCRYVYLAKFPFKQMLWIFKIIKTTSSFEPKKVAMVNPFTKRIITIIENYITEYMFVHEYEHIKQIEKEGKIKFIIKYLFYTLRYGYENNPYEIEAVKAADDSINIKHS